MREEGGREEWREEWWEGGKEEEGREGWRREGGRDRESQWSDILKVATSGGIVYLPHIQADPTEVMSALPTRHVVTSFRLLYWCPGNGRETERVSKNECTRVRGQYSVQITGIHVCDCL